MPASDRDITRESAMATRQVPMDSMRKTALVAGVLYLITFIAGIPPAAFLLASVVRD